MRALASLLLALVLVTPAAAAPPQRIVSLNLCADSLLLELVDPARVVSLTALSLDPELGHFYRRAEALQAAGMHFNTGLAEQVLPLEPDLVIVMADAAPFTRRLLQRFGLRVLELEPGERLASYRRNLRRLAGVLGQQERAEALLADMDARLGQLRVTAGARPRAMVLQASGFTAGSDTLIDDVLALAGIDNLAARAGLRGYGFLSLEQFIHRAPEMLIVGDSNPRWPSLAHELLEHRALQAAGTERVRVTVPERDWTCGGAYLAKVAERLARQRPAFALSQ